MYKVIHIDFMEDQNNVDNNFNPKEVLISFIYILFLVFLTYIFNWISTIYSSY